MNAPCEIDAFGAGAAVAGTSCDASLVSCDCRGVFWGDSPSAAPAVSTVCMDCVSVEFGFRDAVPSLTGAADVSAADLVSYAACCGIAISEADSCCSCPVLPGGACIRGTSSGDADASVFGFGSAGAPEHCAISSCSCGSSVCTNPASDVFAISDDDGATANDPDAVGAGAAAFGGAMCTEESVASCRDADSLDTGTVEGCTVVSTGTYPVL